MYAKDRERRYHLPAEGRALLQRTVPFLPEMIDDLVCACHHPHAGDLVICGWRGAEQSTVSFAQERGGHGGLGLRETEAFALLPDHIFTDLSTGGYLRPRDLRQAAIDWLKPPDPAAQRVRPALQQKTDSRLRVMTYNVHSCVGIDGRLSPERIARVIAQYHPDLVALQELDVGRRRTGGEDQAYRLAQCLDMDVHFNATLHVEEEIFGDAVLSRQPLHLVKAAPLPSLPNGQHLERRGALWVRLPWGDRCVQLLNTHLGLDRRERLSHICELCGPTWLGSCMKADPMIVCGDFNALPGSRVCRMLGQSLRNVQSILPSRPRPTWRGRYPVLCLDHIFVSSDFLIERVTVGDTDLARVASDHRPLITDLRLKE